MLCIKRTTLAAALGLAPVYLFGCLDKSAEDDGTQSGSGGMDENTEFDPDCEQAKGAILNHIRDLYYKYYCCDQSKSCVGGKTYDKKEDWQDNKFIEDVWDATKEELKATGKPCTMANVKKIIKEIHDCTLVGKPYWPEEQQMKSFYIRAEPAFCAIKDFIKRACKDLGLNCDDKAVEDAFMKVVERLKAEYGKDEVAKIVKAWVPEDLNNDGYLDIPNVVMECIGKYLAELKSEA